MEEIIDDIMAYMNEKTANVTNLDRHLICDELVKRMADESAEALKQEYMAYWKEDADDE